MLASFCEPWSLSYKMLSLRGLAIVPIFRFRILFAIVKVIPIVNYVVLKKFI